MHHRYHINLFWPDEDECWIVDLPDLIHCSAHGAISEAALAEVNCAIAAWLGVQAEAACPAPGPRYRPASYTSRGAA